MPYFWILLFCHQIHVFHLAMSIKTSSIKNHFFINFIFQDCFQRSICPKLTCLGFQPVVLFNDCVWSVSTFLLEMSWLHFVSHAYLVTGRGTYSFCLILFNFYIFMLRNAGMTRVAHTVSLQEEMLLTLCSFWLTPEISSVLFLPSD